MINEENSETYLDSRLYHIEWKYSRPERDSCHGSAQKLNAQADLSLGRVRDAADHGFGCLVAPKEEEVTWELSRPSGLDAFV